MRRFGNSLGLLLVAVLALAQSSSELMTPDVLRVGSHLACLCGACNNTVANCPMLECHYARPAKERIYRMIAEGRTDEEIIQSFVDEHGLQALAVPPKEGFNLLGWVMPFVAIAFGLLLIWWFVRRYLGVRVAAPGADDEVLERYRDRIERDLSKLDS